MPLRSLTRAPRAGSTPAPTRSRRSSSAAPTRSKGARATLRRRALLCWSSAPTFRTRCCGAPTRSCTRHLRRRRCSSSSALPAALADPNPNPNPDPDPDPDPNPNQVQPQLYLLRWLRLLFGREFHLSDSMLVWDAIFAYGQARAHPRPPLRELPLCPPFPLEAALPPEGLARRRARRNGGPGLGRPAPCAGLYC